MASITSTGIGSGLDVNSIVSQLLAVESRPLNLLQKAKTELNTQLSAVGKLQSFTSALQDAAGKLASTSLWTQTTATSSDAAAVAVSARGGAAAGRWAVEVQSLAAQQTLASRAFASPEAELSSGTLTIELGRWGGTAAAPSFAPKAGAAAVTITIGPGDTSLESVRDKINAAAAGVTATIVNDGSGARLALRSTATGADNGFRIRADEDFEDAEPALGLSALAWDPTREDTQLELKQSAADARATIDGIAVASASNVLEDVVDGITLTLAKPTTAPVVVDVKADDEAVKTAVTGFTKAFNDLASYIREQTRYDPASKTAGTLQGDRTALGLQAQLRGVVNRESTASSRFGRLADAGITMQADGTLAVNAGKLDAALASRGELRKLFAADAATDAASGFARRFRSLAAAVLQPDGALDSRADGLNAQIARNDRGQEAQQSRLAQVEKRLRQQYQTLDANMARLGGLANYMNGQIAALNKSGSGG